MNTKDRLIRAVTACVLFGIAYWASSGLLLAVAIFTVFEVLSGWCMVYYILGKSSCDI